ncbi:helix-turn-helix domain-containing protein [Streptomyces sp. NPDC008150]|uniref:helix-turn-helix domain-containing protein n=1 Tax=Streptomyces sp. NPDC008150 TaxID=3364816 RepID=UPI0036EBC545
MSDHGTPVRQRALTLLRDGIRNADVARLLSVPVGTVGYWKHTDRAARGECPGRHGPPCPRCDGRPLDEAAYSYLLGLYLGDGHVVEGRRAAVLSVTCCETWPGLREECAAAMRAVFPANRVWEHRRTGCRDVRVCSRHVLCLFPQHGAGRKHERRIELAGWQREITAARPWEFLRGLIHSDGCRITNWTTRTVAGERKRYEYPRYLFTNVSDDIRQLYTDTLDALDIRWTHCTRHGSPYNISVARRACTALMDAHIGPKY